MLGNGFDASTPLSAGAARAGGEIRLAGLPATEGAFGRTHPTDHREFPSQRQAFELRLISFVTPFEATRVRLAGQLRLLGRTSTGTVSRLRTRTANARGLAVVIALAMWGTGCQREPVYQGKSLSYWLDQLEDRPYASEPMEAVRQVGTNAIPVLMSRLQTKAPLSSRLAESFSHRWKWAAAARESQRGRQAAARRRFSAVVGFEALGDSAEGSVPALLKLLRSEKLASDSIAAIVHSLGAIGPPARDAVPCLVKILPPGPYLNFSGNLPSRRFAELAACRALGQIHSKPELAIPALVKQAGSPRPAMRAAAVESLAQFGADAKPALRVIQQGLQDADEDVRRSCTNALQHLGTGHWGQEGISQ